jgi:hypothetical protein
MNELSRRSKIIIAFVVMIVGGGVLTYVSSISRGVSPAFVEARMQGALIAQGIVSSSQSSTVALEEINRLDRQGDYGSALELTNRLIDQNKEIKDKAIALSHELETMTRSLDSISSEDARTAALNSITNRLAMITRLIQYSDSLGKLLETLKLRFSGEAYGDNRTIRALLDEINTEVNAINNFDHQAQQAIVQFDTIINKDNGR